METKDVRTTYAVRKQDFTADLIREVMRVYGSVFHSRSATSDECEREDNELLMYATEQNGEWRFGGRGAHKLWVRKRLDAEWKDWLYAFDAEVFEVAPSDQAEQDAACAQFVREVDALLAQRGIAVPRPE